MENKQVNKKSDNSKVILIVVILILLGVIGYLVFTNQEKESTIATQSEKINADSLEKAKTLKEYQDLQLHYQKLKEENQALGLETASLDSTIQALNVTIQKVRNSNASEVKRWKGKLEALQTEFTQVKTDLESKIRENEVLGAKLDSMRLNDQLLADSINNLTAVKTALAEKVAIASVLRAENIKVASVSSKGKETVDTEFKAKSISKLKVFFNLAENEVAKKESKDIYMRLLEPNGSTLFEGDKLFILDGKETFYTEKRTINFDNSKQQVVFVYEKGSPYKPGNYTVQFYAEGRKIGETALAVK
jgi:predicted RNase H-like nuclease (RuvC/YqgF family)